MIVKALSETQARRRLVHASHGIGAGAALHGAVDAFRTQLLGRGAVRSSRTIAGSKWRLVGFRLMSFRDEQCRRTLQKKLVLVG